MTDLVCTSCHKKKPGRFTRRPQAAGGGWDQGLSLPYWYCYICLPLGQGRDEQGVDPMPAKSALVAPKLNPATVKQEGLSTLTPLQTAIADLPSVLTAEDYIDADTLRDRIRNARKTWKDRMEKIIRPIRQGLDELYSLNRDVDVPLGTLEDSVTGRMKVFKLEETRLLRAAEEAREQEAQRLRNEAAQKELASEQARTVQMRGRLHAAAARAWSQAEEVEQEEIPTPIQVASSTTRPKRSPVVTDRTAFLKGIVAGYVPENCIAIIQPTLNRYYRDDPEGMAAWPGVTLVDDIQIVGR